MESLGPVVHLLATLLFAVLAAPQSDAKQREQPLSRRVDHGTTLGSAVLGIHSIKSGNNTAMTTTISEIT